jgi:hypothetical protein
MNAEWGTISAFWVSTAATLVAAGAAWISYAVYRSQADPDVMVYVEADERRPSIFNLIIKNNGKAPAHDVMFSSDFEIPSEAYGLDPSGDVRHKKMTCGPLVHGIPYLPPNGRRVITWGQFGGLYDAIGENHLIITARYKSQHFGLPWKIRHRQMSILEISSFKSTDVSDKNYDKLMAVQLEEIAKALRGIAFGSQRG